MIAWIKEHKALAIGGVVALVILFFVLRGGSSATSASQGSSSDVAAATALQSAQQAASYQGAQLSAASQAQSEQTAAQLELGKLSIANAGAHDQLAATVATSNINANEQLQSLLGQLSANVATGAQNADVAKTTVLATNQTQQQQILADAVMHQSDNQVATAVAGYNATAGIAADKYAHTGGLFGGGGFLGLGI